MTTEIEEIQNSIRETCYICVEEFLLLLHPIMPFISEELWQRLPRFLDY